MRRALSAMAAYVDGLVGSEHAVVAEKLGQGRNHFERIFERLEKEGVIGKILC